MYLALSFFTKSIVSPINGDQFYTNVELVERDPSTSRDDPETQVFKSEETGHARFGFCCCYCFGLVWLLLFVYFKTAHQSFSFPTKFFDSTLECALQLSIFLRKIIDNNIFSFLSSLGSLCSFLAPQKYFAPTVPLLFTSKVLAEILQSV